MSSVTNFIHFGCWNYDDCKENTPIAKVTTAVKKAIETHAVQYLIVAGDNYYPIKNKNIDLNKGASKEEQVNPKLINPTMLHSGFSCLPDIPTYILWGNHDLDNSSVLRLYEGTVDRMKTVSNVELGQPDTCQIMTTELSHPSSNLIFPPSNQFVNYRKDGNTLTLMLDTTMYDISNKDKSDNRTCYEKYYGTFNLEDLRERQRTSVLQILERVDDIQHLILVGHHPLLYPKLKEKKIKPVYLDTITPLLLEIHAMFQDRPMQYVYLCADYHNYQEGIVRIGEMQIKQYIVGTGGTKLDDPLDRDPGILETPDGSQYQLQKEIHEYGFLMGSLSSGDPTFEFISVSKTGGKRTRHKRYKRKRTRRSVS